MADANAKKTRKPRKPAGPRKVYAVFTTPEGVDPKDVNVHYAGGNAAQVLEKVEALREAGENAGYSKFEVAPATAE